MPIVRSIFLSLSTIVAMQRCDCWFMNGLYLQRRGVGWLGFDRVPVCEPVFFHQTNRQPNSWSRSEGNRQG